MDFPQEFGSASHRLRSWRDAAAGPYPDAATAAEDVVRLLSRLAPSTDLWLVTATEGRRFSGRQSLLARLRPPTSSLCGDQEAFIRLMLTGSGTASRRALMPADHPDLGRPAVSYVASPILGASGTVLGTVCGAVASADGFEELCRRRPEVSTAARMLATVLEPAGPTGPGADRDPETGLRNAGGFADVLRAEQNRCRTFGSKASVVIIEVHGSSALLRADGPAERSKVLAELLSQVCHDCDVLARLDASRFAVLTIETDIRGATALAVRLRRRLREAGVTASLGVASRRTGEDLRETLYRAALRPTMHTHRSRRAAPRRLGRAVDVAWRDVR